MKGNKKYTEEEALQMLQNLYQKREKPITTKMVREDKSIPSTWVYDKMFGTLKNACEKINIPYETAKATEKYRMQLNQKLREEREGQERINGQKQKMTCISYDNADSVKVQFDDPLGTIVTTCWCKFDKGITENPNFHATKIGDTNYNHQNCLMKIVDYIDCNTVIVEFQDEYLYRTKTRYERFISGCVKNPFAPTVCSVGIVGNKYPIHDDNKKIIREYNVWSAMIKRCFDENPKGKLLRYKDVACCAEWKLFWNFYEWLHEQENFDYWLSHKDAQIDKDILSKGNKIYSPETCLLVPHCVNLLFRDYSNARKTTLPVGVYEHRDRYMAYYCKRLGFYDTLEEAFQAYKAAREAHIKEVAEREYQKGTISKKCYDAMMVYTVEITD